MKNIHVLPTPNPSRLFIDEDDTKLRLYKEPMVSVYATNQNIYITNSEEIKEGDWCITAKGNLLQMIEGDTALGFTLLGCKKIILTTDADLIKDGVQAIEDEFLGFIVKNPSCEVIKVNKLCYGALSGFADAGYKINLSSEEPQQERMYSEEEVLIILDKFLTSMIKGEKTGLIEEWFKQFRK